MVDSTSTVLLGDDILDTRAFGNSWERLLEAAFPDPEQLRVVLDVVKHGIAPAAVVVPEDEQAFEAALHASFFGSQRLIFAALAVAPITERGRLWGLLSRDTVGSLTSTIQLCRMARRSAGASLLVSDLQRLASVFGWDEGEIIEAALRRGAFADTADFVVQNADAVRSAMQSDRSRLWGVLFDAPDVALRFADELIDDLVSTNQRLRHTAAHLAKKVDAPQLVPRVKERIESGGALERWRAAEWLLESWPTDAATPADLAWLDDRLESETSAKASGALERLRVRLNEQHRPVRTLPEVVFEAVTFTAAEWAEIARATKPITVPPEDVRTFLEGGALTSVPGVGSHAAAGAALYALGRVSFDAAPRFSAATWTRLLLAGAPLAGWFSHTTAPVASPLHVSAVADHDGRSFAGTARLVSALSDQHPDFWSAADLAEWVAHHATDIASELMSDSRRWGNARQVLLGIVFDMTDRPERVERVLIQEALTGRAGDRDLIIDHLGDDYRDVFHAYLKSKSQAERFGAVDWVRRHPDSAAASALLDAARVEKDDRVLAVFLTQLEAMDVNIDEFLSRSAVRDKAVKAMKKKSSRSKAIEWLDVDSLPPLRWADGEAVDADVVAWMLHTAAKNKTARPSPIARRHLAGMDPEGVEAFGRELLSRWEYEDLKPIDEPTARANAVRQAKREVQSAARHPQYYPTYVGMSEEQIVEALVGEALKVPGGSARTSQGLLAVVAACGGNDVVVSARNYVRKYRGKRASQSKALIEMLAWIDDPASVQVVMSMANRFRPKALQQAAAAHVAELAEHHGWSMDDLADRSVPDGGFDPDGRRVFDLGTRSFTASLTDELTIVLTDDDGKTVKSLPRGRADEDGARIKELKAEFKELKSDVADAAEFQPVRLRRAMAGSRMWPAEDFRRFILEHPVMVRMASRAMWVHVPNDGGTDTASVFRPLSDGTLLTMDDEEYELDGGAVLLAHDQGVGKLDSVRVTEHLSDYEVSPLFSQVGRPHVVVTDGQMAIEQFRGSTISTNTLANSARKLGWQVADTEGLGSSVGVVISFPDLDQEAVLRVENGLHLGGYDYQDYDCTISDLVISPMGQRSKRLPLDSISPVLLSEVVADVISIVGSPMGDA